MNAITDTGTDLRAIFSPIDARLAFLARASARHYLVAHGEMDLGAAFTELVPAFEAIHPCACDRSRLDMWNRQDRHRVRYRRRR